MKLAFAVRETVAGHTLGALEGGTQVPLPSASDASLPPAMGNTPLEYAPSAVAGQGGHVTGVLGRRRTMGRSGSSRTAAARRGPIFPPAPGHRSGPRSTRAGGGRRVVLWTRRHCRRLAVRPHHYAWPATATHPPVTVRRCG